MSKVTEYMFSKRILPILFLLLGCGVFIAFRTFGKVENPPTKNEKILQNVGKMLSQMHYSPKDINDKFSREVYKKYMEFVDPKKNILLQSDEDLLKKYETTIDDEILGAPIQFVPAVTEIVKKRMAETEKIYRDLLAQPFEFNKDETAVLDPEKLSYAKTEADRKELWRKSMKYMVLDKYVDLLSVEEKSKGKKDHVAKSNEQLEKEARQKVLMVMDRYYNRIKVTVSDDDRFNRFVDFIANTMDPHSNFFPPVDSRQFSEEVSGHFFGIGASLRLEDNAIKIVMVVAGSPASKSGDIQAGDVITKVAQGNEEPVDLTGYEVVDAVKLIRGTKGSEVKLTIRKSDGAIKVVSLIRDDIVLEDSYARSLIVDNGKSKIGYINLPGFYHDFANPQAPRSFDDVRKEIIKLKADKVDGIILDLRYNGGGALTDVIDMAGLFIEDGPIVQVKSRDGKPSLLMDHDKSVLYDGPLEVMVNEMSASASEIFAAAIQDYKRGIIIGSTSTYGKGTVQQAIDLERVFGKSMGMNSDLGALKVTLSKYYRINGGSTQLKGVHSDIVLPDEFEYIKIREKDDPDALPWDTVKRAPYTTWKPNYDLQAIESASNARISNNDVFNLIKKNAAWLAKQNDKTYSLKLDKYRDEIKQITSINKELDTLVSKLPKGVNIRPLTGEENKYASDKNKEESMTAWKKRLMNDIYLNEAINVMNDMSTAQKLAVAATKN